MASEKVASEKWLDEVKAKLTLREERIRELQRFCNKFVINNLCTTKGDAVSYETALKNIFDGWDVRGCIGQTQVVLRGDYSKNKPYIYLEAELGLENRKLQIKNSVPDVKKRISAPQTEFSDESLMIAKAVSDVLAMKQAYAEHYYHEYKEAESLIVFDEVDSIVVAYNKLYPRDC